MIKKLIKYIKIKHFQYQVERPSLYFFRKHQIQRGWECKTYKLLFLYIHWHSGFHNALNKGDPYFRLRGIRLFGWLVPQRAIPFKYYLS